MNGEWPGVGQSGGGNACEPVMFLSVLQVLGRALEIGFAWGVVLRIAGFGGVSGGGVASTFVCPEEGIGSRFGWYWLCSGWGGVLGNARKSGEGEFGWGGWLWMGELFWCGLVTSFSSLMFPEGCLGSV